MDRGFDRRHLSRWPKDPQISTPVGSYGTRNIVVIGIMVLEPPTDCIVLMIRLSSILRGIPLSGGIRLALSLRP
jgi:hypothetical protein